MSIHDQPAQPAPQMHLPPLHNKTVLVTGAGRGLGQSIAVACASAGAHVIGTVRADIAAEETRALINDLGGSFESRIVDLRDSTAVNVLAADVRSQVGTIDALVNNSGIAGPTQPATAMTDDDWDEVINVNLTGVFRCCRAFLPQMIDKRSGSIINIGSVSARAGLLNRTPYAASKAALSGLTRTLALEAGPHCVRVNIVTPGAIEGKRIQHVIDGQAAAAGQSPDDVRNRLTAQSALRRFVAPNEVADTVVFLASDAAQAITGADVNVTAGFAFD